MTSPRILGVLCLLLLLVAGVQAQGPDVIVGAITGPQNYSASGGYDAFSLGTTSCNVGTQPLTWIASNNQHPVIGGTLYRHYQGRFQMAGQSWLKHGFTALQGTLCGSCNAYPNGTALGVGCSDPYSAGLNGSQSSLGPKYQVNASSGFFNYPPANPSWSGSVARRLAVPLSLLAAPGASWVAEAQYIQPEDALLNNDNNNASYRMASVTGTTSNYSLGFAGSTVQQQPAIQAWAALDAGVSLYSIEVAGANGGQFTRGVTRIPLGNGMWRFEYAVHNLNCHASAGSFTVNFNNGVAISNMGFYSPQYLWGETFNNNAWLMSSTSNGATWMVDQTFSQNPNSNALRWGTTYNFWFDANDPNPLGESLGLYRQSGTESFPAPTFPTPSWQVNQAGASMDIDGLTNGGFTGPIEATKLIGTSGNINFAANGAGIPWDVAVTTVSAIPNGTVTGQGQIINVDLLHPSLTFINGTFQALTPGSAWTVPFVSPGAPVFATGQMAVLDPTSGEGIFVSAANELSVVICAQGNQSLSLGDDTNQAINLGVAPHDCIQSVNFVGTSYTTAFVNSNGSVSFTTGSNDFQASTFSFTSQMPRLAGLWSDLNPASGGTIVVTSNASGLFSVNFNAVPEFGSGVPSTFSMEFDSVSGGVAIANYSAGLGHSTTSIVGLSPGGGAPGLPRTFSTYVGSGSQTGAANAAVYQISGGAPQGFTRIDFPNGDGSTFIVN